MKQAKWFDKKFDEPINKTDFPLLIERLQGTPVDQRSESRSYTAEQTGSFPRPQSTLLQIRLEQAGVANKVVFYPSLGHGWYSDKLSDSFNQIAAFLDQHME